MIQVHTNPASFLAAAIVVILLLLFYTITGRFLLRKIVLALAIVAGAAIVAFDGHSPL
ncbi:hypothetical protein [Glycomyces tarimensis]